MAHDTVRQLTRVALGQPVDPVMQLPIALDADGVVPALGFQQVKERRDGEGSIGPEPAPFDRGPSGCRVSGPNQPQDIFPAIGAVDIAGAQGTALQITELVEHEQGM